MLVFKKHFHKNLFIFGFNSTILPSVVYKKIFTCENVQAEPTKSQTETRTARQKEIAEWQDAETDSTLNNFRTRVDRNHKIL